MEILEQAKGSTRKYGRTITYDGRNAVVNTFSGSEAFVVELWRGDDQTKVALSSNTKGVWDSAAAGTWTLWVDDADLAALEVGTYPLVVRLTGAADGEPREVMRAALRLLPIAGTGTARAVYSTYDDMRRHAGKWLDDLFAKDTDETGFAEQRADAREELEDLAHRHFRGGGRGFGYTGLSTSSGLRNSWLIDALATNQLLVTRAVKDFCSLYALGLVCRRQVGTGDQSAWRSKAGDYFRQAEDVAKTLTLEIDTNADGLGEVAIELGSVDARRA